MSNEMELFSFLLEKDVLKEEEIYYLEFPPSWWEFIDSKRYDGYKYKLSIYPSALNRKLTTIFPEIFRAEIKPGLPWLLADEKVDPNILKVICLRWFEMETDDLLPEEMRKEELVWKRGKLGDFDNFLFSCVAGLMARRFAREKKQFTLHKGEDNEATISKEIQFRHINYDGRHECMSEPVYNENQDSYFSYVIRFNVQTRAGFPEDAILNVRLGVRRFVQKSINIPDGISRRYNGTILVGMKNPFYSNTNIKSMSVWKFSRNKGYLNWQYEIDELLLDVIFEDIDLTPANILKNPLDYMNNDTIEALAVYSTSVYHGWNKSNALPGLGLLEKAALFELVKSEFSHLQPLNLLHDIKKWHSSKNIHPLLHTYDAGKTLRLEVWSYSNIASKLKEILIEKSIVKSVNNSNIMKLNCEPVLNLEIVERNPENVIHALDRDKFGERAEFEYKKKLENVFRRIDGRRNHKFILSLIEIDRPEDYGRNDPKQALRRAFSKANRISQFIHPESAVGGFDERLLSSFYDLLTDCGFLPNRLTKINPQGIFVSLGILAEFKKKAYPVISKLDSHSLHLRMFGSKQWMSLPQSLFFSSNIRRDQLLYRYNNNDKAKLINFFKEGLLDILEKTEEKVIVLVDHRVKYFWNIFTNPKINKDFIFRQIGIEQYKNRVIFVRVNPSDEIPQYRINPKGRVEPFMGSGVFGGKDGIYYSVSLRPDTMMNIGKTHTKYENPNKLLLQQGITELVPIGYQSRDYLDEIIRVVYKTRRLLLAYNFHTRYPYLLHLNGKLRKYITFITSEGIWDEFDERVEGNIQLQFDI